MFVIDESLPIELTPLAFLIGTWAGSGVISHEGVDLEFSQQVTFAPEGEHYLRYQSNIKMMDAPGTPLPGEVGFWRLATAAQPGEAGPGLLPAAGLREVGSREGLEALRNEQGGFDLLVSTLHPGGVAELYHGIIKGARIDLASAAGAAFTGSKTYRHSTRMYGLVEGALLWVWDIALVGDELKSHASARLERVDGVAGGAGGAGGMGFAPAQRAEQN